MDSQVGLGWIMIMRIMLMMCGGKVRCPRLVIIVVIWNCHIGFVVHGVPHAEIETWNGPSESVGKKFAKREVFLYDVVSVVLKRFCISAMVFETWNGPSESVGKKKFAKQEVFLYDVVSVVLKKFCISAMVFIIIMFE